MPSTEVGSSETTVDVHLERAHGFAHLAIADRAHRAQLLGQDQVGIGLLEGGLIEVVDRRSAVDRIADPPVDLAAVAPTRSSDIARHDRQADDFGRPVALVGDPDELVAQPEGADDLGGGRQEGDDPHRAV